MTTARISIPLMHDIAQSIGFSFDVETELVSTDIGMGFIEVTAAAAERCAEAMSGEHRMDDGRLVRVRAWYALPTEREPGHIDVVETLLDEKIEQVREAQRHEGERSCTA